MTRVWALALVAVTASAQAPRIGEINFYGLRKVPAEKILTTLQLKSGDTLPPSKGDMEDAIEKIPGVVMARVQAVCCEGRSVALFIGVEERGAPLFAVHSPPAGNAELPEDLVDTYHKFLSAVEEAARRGATAEDLSSGQPLMIDPKARAYQQQFVAYATAHLDLLRSAIHEAAEPDVRAVAVAVIGYAPKKAGVINDLQYAMQDPDEAVRSNAMRALESIAAASARQSKADVPISATWFVEMLNSISLSDRQRAAEALVTLTDHGNREALEQIRERALPAVVEMARWKTLRYALPAFLLVGRMAGLPEKQIQEQWSKGAREAVIQKVMAQNQAGRGDSIK
ncbi:MAG TPA: HEAT repeat domain-containing protein [Bryobacteraceae bacterium]|nr:HEAT repeat domain-containing protein [Bryobacteraceae bacterium]